MKLNALALGMITLALGACGEGNKSSGPAPRKEIVERYSFTFNRCPTNEQVFKGMDPVAVRKELCEALQDHERNGRCAEDLRRDHFEAVCPGLEWKPRYAQREPVRPAPVPTRPESSLVESEDPLNVFKAAEGLKFKFAENVELAAGLQGTAKSHAQQLAADIQDCGLDATGPRCLDFNSLRMINQRLVILNETDRMLVSFVVESGRNLAVLAPMKANALLATELEIVLLAQPFLSGDVKVWLDNKSHYQSLLKAQLEPEFMASVRSRFANPANLRHLYYTIRSLREYAVQTSADTIRATEALAARAIDKNVDLIVSSEQKAYQQRFLDGILESYPVAEEKKAEIYEKFFAGTDNEFREIAAIRLLRNDGKRADVKPVVVVALKNERSSLRREALEALGQAASLSAVEKNAALGLLRDDDYGVRLAAKKLADRLDLDAGQIPVLKEALESQLSGIRLISVELLSRIADRQASDLILARMEDDDYSVRQAAQAAARTRKVNSDQQGILSAQMKSPLASVRLNALELMATLNGEKPGLSIIEAIEDTDYSVRQKAWSILKIRKLGSVEIVAVLAVLRSSLASNRLSAVELLAGYGHAAILPALILAMSDDDYGVRQKAIHAVEAKSPGVVHLDLLKKELESIYTPTRKSVVQHLARIGTPAALALLRAQVKVELDYSVRQDIEKVLKGKN